MDNKSEQNSGVNISNPGEKITRRTLFKRVGLALGGISLAWGSRISKVEASHQSSDNQDMYPKEITDRGIKIFFDTENLPVNLFLADGKEVTLNRQKVLKAKESAQRNNEPEFVALIPIEAEKDKSSNVNSPEHPILDSIPEDAVSSEELQRRRVEVIQSPEVEFFIRKRAFGKGGVFENFTEGGDRNLKIVLLNSAVVAAPFLEEERYADVRAYLEDKRYLIGDKFLSPDFISEFQDKQLKDLADLRNLLIKQPANSDLMGKITNIKELVFRMENTSKEQLLKLLTELVCTRTGLYIPPYVPEYPYLSYPQKSKENPNTSVIFLAVGDSVMPQEELKMYFDPSGELKFVVGKNTVQSAMPTEKDSMPDPERYRYNMDADELNPNSYAYSTRDVVIRVYHEGTHNRMIEQSIALGDLPDMSEYRTDTGAMRSIRSVSTKWRQSGYTDHSDSSFGFRLKNGKVIIFKGSISTPTAA